MSWIRDIGRKLSGAEAREKAATELREKESHARLAAEILSEHEAREYFAAQEALDRLRAVMPEERAISHFKAFLRSKLEPIIQSALEDNLLTPEEDDRISRVRERYGNIKINEESEQALASARRQYDAWTRPLEAVETPLLLKRGEFCVHAIQAQAFEERQRTLRVNYSGPTARIRIVKGVYYRVGSIQTQRETEAYSHSFGTGVLGATNSRLLWVSPAKSISIPLTKIVMFEPYNDGLKVIKDTGKPILFVFDAPDQSAMVRISRVIEELR